jgi:hypothetical protein
MPWPTPHRWLEGLCSCYSVSCSCEWGWGKAWPRAPALHVYSIDSGPRIYLAVCNIQVLSKLPQTFLLLNSMVFSQSWFIYSIRHSLWLSSSWNTFFPSRASPCVPVKVLCAGKLLSWANWDRWALYLQEILFFTGSGVQPSSITFCFLQ